MRKNIDKADLLNDYFSSQTVLDESQTTSPKFTSRNRHSLEPIHVHTNPHEVEETLNLLSVEEATGPDGINNKLLKQISKPLSKPLGDPFIFFL